MPYTQILLTYKITILLPLKIIPANLHILPHMVMGLLLHTKPKLSDKPSTRLINNNIPVPEPRRTSLRERLLAMAMRRMKPVEGVPKMVP